MTTIKLILPKGYDTIKQLCDSTGRPIRCTPIPVTDPTPARSCCAGCSAVDCSAAICDQQEAFR